MKKNDKKKILYLMHVDINFIKQRPHFLAKHLSTEFDFIILYQKNLRKHQIPSEEKNVLKSRPIWRLPLSRFDFIHKINKIIYRVQLYINSLNVDYIWITHPSLYEADLSKKVIYDCMDDISNFTYASTEKKIEVLTKEKELFANTMLTIFSSETLALKYKNNTKNYLVVNNAIEKIDDVNKLSTIGNEIKNKIIIDKKEAKIAIYVGTVSDWFDFESLEFVSNECDDYIFYVIGPNETKITNKERIKFVGPVRHTDIFTLMKFADVLIMPFIVNDLIRSVDPVKIYDYISTSKPIITPHYYEMEKFSDFVFTYTSKEEFLKLLKMDDELNKYKERDAKKFIGQNDWSSRAKQISKKLSI